jgi:isoquinoline 1-oxidoreductase beta subunit
MLELVNFSRRRFLQLSTAGGTALVLGIYWPTGAASVTSSTFAPNAFLSIDSEGRVTLWVAKSEMGQGVRTALPMILAEELEAEWSSVRIEQAVADPKYGRMTTGGSTSVRGSWETLRRAGATAREMLIAAAAKRWNVEPRTCSARKGTVVHNGTGARFTYAELVRDAVELPVPSNVALKDPKDFRLLGRSLPRVDVPEKVDGSATFGIDVRVPKMLYAAVARCPVFGGKLDRFEAAPARRVRGVRNVVRVDTGVAVLADSTWAALKGREALEVTWDAGPNANLGSAQISQMLERRSHETGAIARREGDAISVPCANGRKLEAVYEVPFLAHATMEPMNCLADARKDRCEVWAPTQSPDRAQDAVAKLLSLPTEKVIIHTTLLGGGFGRRLQTDYVVEAVQISKAANAPVKVVWTRDDDLQHDFYRPVSMHRLSAAFDDAGKLAAWFHRVVAPSRGPDRLKDGVDETAVEGAVDLPYAVPHVQVEYVLAGTPVPVGAWRSVYNTQNAFASECFVDEVAHQAGKDPYLFRRELLKDAGRHRSVLDLAAKRARWGEKTAPGHFRGIAVHECFGSFVAEVAEITIAKDGTVAVPRVVCAIDCGMTVNPDTIVAQVQSAVIYGLGPVLRQEITIEQGRVKQSSFYEFDPIRMNEAPVVEVHIVPSSEPPGGVGEPGVPPIAPAVINAVFAATGKRIRRLPIRPEELRSS